MGTVVRRRGPVEVMVRPMVVWASVERDPVSAAPCPVIGLARDDVHLDFLDRDVR